MSHRIFCDHVGCDPGQGQSLTEAVVRVRALRLDGSTLTTIRSYDSCQDHIGEFATKLYRDNRLTKEFAEVRVEPFNRERKE